MFRIIKHKNGKFRMQERKLFIWWTLWRRCNGESFEFETREEAHHMIESIKVVRQYLKDRREQETQLFWDQDQLERERRWRQAL